NHSSCTARAVPWRHPMHWALINGEKEFAISIHKMEKEIDAGEICWQQFIKVKKGMSVKELRSGLMNELESGLPAFLKNLFRVKLSQSPTRIKKLRMWQDAFRKTVCFPIGKTAAGLSAP
ncbi:MAG: hypothetical protein HC867_04475, partial [Bacteroidia bacterium]|nr:hypothetical protein [Bacteroidia bacterium]